MILSQILDLMQYNTNDYSQLILYIDCPLFPAVQPVIAEDPCEPNPCGPNSNPPRVVGDQCRCTCLPEMIGSPPNCRPECVINADCPSDRACINRKCADPCPGLCGVNARCDVRNHLPLCICYPGYVGDPFTQCRRPTSKLYSTNFYISHICPKLETKQTN